MAEKISVGKFINNMDKEDLTSTDLQGVVGNVYAKAIADHKKTTKIADDNLKDKDKETVEFTKSNHDRLKANKDKVAKEVNKDDAKEVKPAGKTAKGVEETKGSAVVESKKLKEDFERELEPGDKIIVRGTSVTIGDILDQYFDKKFIDIEFKDDKGNYRTWKSDIDGGKVVYKESKQVKEAVDDEFEVAKYKGNQYGIWAKTSKNWMMFGKKADLEKKVKELNAGYKEHKKIDEALSYEEAKEYIASKGLKLPKDIYNMILELNNVPNDMVKSDKEVSRDDVISILGIEEDETDPGWIRTVVGEFNDLVGRGNSKDNIWLAGDFGSYVDGKIVDKTRNLIVVESKRTRKGKKLAESEGKIEPGNIYSVLVKELPAEDIDHHYSDLYVRKTPKSTEIINRLTTKSLLSTFKSNIDGDIWYELPFCFSPYFQKEGLRRSGKKLKEGAEKTVIYKSLGKFRATPESNYNARVQNERQIQKLDAFTSADQIMDYYIKYGWAKDKNDFVVIDECKELKEDTFRELGLDKDSELVYEFSGLDREDIRQAKKYGLKDVSKDFRYDGMDPAYKKDTWLQGTFAQLKDYAENYIGGYVLVNGFLFTPDFTEVELDDQGNLVGGDDYFAELKQQWEEEFKESGREPVIEFDSGDYYYIDVDWEDGIMFAGSATNTGIFREYEVDLDPDYTIDEHIAELYDAIVYDKPELIGESKKVNEWYLPKNSKPYKTKDNKEYYIASYSDFDKMMSDNPKANYTIITKKSGEDFDFRSASGLDFETEDDAKKTIDGWLRRTSGVTENKKLEESAKSWVLFFDKDGQHRAGSDWSTPMSVKAPLAKQRTLNHKIVWPNEAEGFIVLTPDHFSGISYDELQKLYNKGGISTGKLDRSIPFTESKELEEDWTVFEFTSGSNPYIAKTEKEVKRLLRKYKGRVEWDTYNGNYIVDDKERYGWDKPMVDPDPLPFDMKGYGESLKESRHIEYIEKELADKSGHPQLQDAYEENELTIIKDGNVWYCEHCPNRLYRLVQREMKKNFPELKWLYDKRESLIKESIKERYTDKRKQAAYENACDCIIYGYGKSYWNSLDLNDEEKTEVWKQAYNDLAEDESLIESKGAVGEKPYIVAYMGKEIASFDYPAEAQEYYEKKTYQNYAVEGYWWGLRDKMPSDLGWKPLKDEGLVENTVTINPKFKAFYDKVNSDKQLAKQLDYLYSKLLQQLGYSLEEIRKEKKNRSVEDKVAEVLEHASVISNYPSSKLAKELNALLDESLTEARYNDGISNGQHIASVDLFSTGVSDEDKKKAEELGHYEIDLDNKVFTRVKGHYWLGHWRIESYPRDTWEEVEKTAKNIMKDGNFKEVSNDEYIKIQTDWENKGH